MAWSVGCGGDQQGATRQSTKRFLSLMKNADSLWFLFPSRKAKRY
jgi:hypothetical protein